MTGNKKRASNKLMCRNSGVLPEGLTEQNLMTKHASQPFNPDIASVLFRAGMIEAWGRGIEKITEICKKAKGVRFEIKYDPGGLWFNFCFEPLLASVETSVENSHTPTKNAEAGKIPGTTQKTILH